MTETFDTMVADQVPEALRRKSVRRRKSLSEIASRAIVGCVTSVGI